jgi:hypothetical protein
MAGREAPRRCGSCRKEPNTIMMSRTATASAAGRSVAMRRQRRRMHAAGRPYCGTNGCTSFLEVDPDTKLATCPICGYSRRLH